MRKEYKKVEKIVIVKEDVFVAFDGTEFEDADDCSIYEERMIKSGKFPLLMNHTHPVGQYDFYDFCWYYVKNEAEAEFLNNYLGHMVIFGDEKLPDWIGVETTYDMEYRHFDTLKKYSKEINDFVNSFRERGMR